MDSLYERQGALEALDDMNGVFLDPAEVGAHLRGKPLLGSTMFAVSRIGMMMMLVATVIIW